MLLDAAVDLVLLAHLLFIAFVVAGAALVARWPALLPWQLAALAWGAGIEFSGWLCPLTLLENALRHAAGEQGYAGDFVSRYLLRLIYPDGLTRGVQLLLGIGVLLLNALLYAPLLRRRARRR
ncbi:DUF2784 domain-containing protein [Thiomonas sp.]|jgi:hypothetical protein|uniref:DUF2784 domain-containing protein n=1 Tax=Thiomonas sp. TaxID=2047785 RepID=UPI00262589DF|nr:DUF2784 domain-containing protein [Thiomonas sp.]